MANNDLIYNAALAGAMGGSTDERWIVSTSGASYTGQRNAAAAFASAVDAAISPDPAMNEGKARLILSLTTAILSKKAITTVVNSGVALAVATVYNELAPVLEPELTPGANSTPNIIWVDPATQAEVSQQTGSISAPFATIVQALEALQAYSSATSIASGTIILADGEYTDETINWDEADAATLRQIDLVGFGAATVTGTWNITGDLGNTTLNVTNVGNPSEVGLNVAAVSGNVFLRMTQGTLGEVSGPLRATLNDVYCTEDVNVTTITAVNCRCDGAVNMSSTGTLTNVSVGGSIGCDGPLTINPGCRIDGDTVCSDLLEARDSRLLSITTLGTATLKSCTVPFGIVGGGVGSVNADCCAIGQSSAIDVFNAKFSTVSSTQATTVLLEDCRVEDVSTITCTNLFVDALTYEKAIRASCTFTATSTTITGLPATAGNKTYNAAAPLVVTILPAGHLPGIYVAEVVVFVQTASSAGNFTSALGWNQPSFGPATLAFAATNVTATGLVFTINRAIQSAGDAAITFTMTPAAIGTAPVINVQATALLSSQLLP